MRRLVVLIWSPQTAVVAVGSGSIDKASRQLWRKASRGEFPPTAVEGGYDGEPLYVIRAEHEGELLPGKLVPSHSTAYISYEGREIAKSQYEVLCGVQPKWVSINGGSEFVVPETALFGGYTIDGEHLYIGRVCHSHVISIGRVLPSQGVCFIPYDGKETPYTTFELFTEAPLGMQPCWKAARSGQVPAGAVAAGSDANTTMFVIRARHESNVIPGKLHPAYRSAYVAYQGREYEKSEYEVLCDCQPQWVWAEDGEVPQDALESGETASGEKLFVGRVTHHGATTIGQVQASSGNCRVPYGGREHLYSEYEVLTVQSKQPPAIT